MILYSPKIKEELIPQIYQIAKDRGIRMTSLVNTIISQALDEMGDKKDNGGNETGIKPGKEEIKDATKNIN